MVVKKLGSPIPERRLVFVPFKNHFASISQSITPAEVLGDATNQERRLLPCDEKNPCKHGGCRSFAMRAAHHYRMFARQKDFFERLRQRAIRNLLFQRFFQLRISTRDDIRDYD